MFGYSEQVFLYWEC